MSYDVDRDFAAFNETLRQDAPDFFAGDAPVSWRARRAAWM